LGDPPTRGGQISTKKSSKWEIAEALKALDNELLQDVLLQGFLTDYYWTDPEVDYDSWHRQALCPLRKPGKGKDYAEEPNNWRGICLAEIPTKIQSSIISMRLLGHLGKIGIRIKTQCGCVPGKGCADALFSMKSALHGQFLLT
jgi:hypothetical protein